MEAPPGHLTALRRHCEDLRDGTHAGVRERADKEAAFRRALELIDPYARQALSEVDDVLLEHGGQIADEGPTRDDDGTLARSWTLSWPEQRARGLAPVTLRAWFGAGFHHPHLRGATVSDWPLNVDDDAAARELLPVLRGIVTADLHNLIFQADWTIIPAVSR